MTLGPPRVSTLAPCIAGEMLFNQTIPVPYLAHKHH